MSILIDKLPQKVVIDNTEYVINSDFRTSIKFENTMLKNDIKGLEDFELITFMVVI